MKYIVSLKTRRGFVKTEVKTLRDAVKLLQSVKGSDLVWLPDSAAEFERQLKKGWSWCRRLWHTSHLPRTKALARAYRRHSRMKLKATGKVSQ